MNINEQKLIEYNIRSHMTVLNEKLKQYIDTTNKTSKSLIYSYSNPQIINSHISYFPHGDPKEDTIDISINILLKSNISVDFDCDICKSSGEIIMSIENKNIDYCSIENLLSQINLFSQQCMNKILENAKIIVV